MPPFVASILWFILLLALFRYDPAKEPTTSSALWVPLIWLFIVGSRLPSQWLGGQTVGPAQAFEEGNPLDRTVFSVLILLAIVILTRRGFNWGGFFLRNSFLTAFLLFALVSAVWSDFPFVVLKRWFRGLGDYLVILVALSDPRPVDAVRTLIRRLCYLLIPLSILLIKYYPYIGKEYSPWTGAPMFVGATTGKNMLGVVCLISGVFFLWDTATRWPQRKERLTKSIIRLNILFMGMTLWLLNLANSATSSVCLVLGCLVIAAARSRRFVRRPRLLKAAIGLSLCSYMVLQIGFGINSQVAEAVGRNSTLTGRTELWKILLSMHTNALIGTGYESFWLGPRLHYVWQKFAVINEAHNGYLEIYLNLGLIGLFLLVGFLIASYRQIFKKLSSGSILGSLSLALWTILLFYNVTEAAFKFHPMWFAFLLVGLSVPARAADRLHDTAAFRGHEDTAEPFASFAFEPTSYRR